MLAQELQPDLLDAFRDELQKIGYAEGTDIKIDVRDASGQNDRLPVLAQELLSSKVEVIVAVNTPAGAGSQENHPKRTRDHHACGRPGKVGPRYQPCQTGRERHRAKLHAGCPWAKRGGTAPPYTSQHHENGCAVPGR